MTSLSTLAPGDLPVLAEARALGFDKLSYTIDVLDGEIDPPLEMLGCGLSLEYMRAFLPRITDDPLRRKIARGEVRVRTTPIVFENTGVDIRVAEQEVQAGDPSLLAWCLSQGVRTGVTFRIGLEHGRCASLNFYSAASLPPQRAPAVIPALFLAGHRLHEHLASRRRASTEALLSPREAECLRWMAQGKSNCEIARQLGLSTETVKEYAQGLYRKLKVRTRSEAVARGFALTYLQ